MAEPTDPRTQAMAYWGIISSAASEHAGAAEAAIRVRDEAARLGHSPGFQVFQEAERLYADATRLQYGSEALSAAPDTHAIQGDYLAKLPYGAGLLAPGGPRQFHVRVNYTYQAGGQTLDDYITLRYTGGLPATVGDLRSDAESVALGLIPSYGRELVQLGDIQIGEL